MLQKHMHFVAYLPWYENGRFGYWRSQELLIGRGQKWKILWRYFGEVFRCRKNRDVTQMMSW